MSSALPHFALEDTMVNLEELGETMMFSEPMLPPLRTPSPSSLSQDSCHTEDAESRGKLVVRVLQSVDVRCGSTILLGPNGTTTTDAGMPIYKMTSDPRGLALIIDIEDYINDVQEKRIGSHMDVANLYDLFSQLGFRVTVKQNLVRSEFDRTLDTFAQDPGHAEADMMVLIVLSHGLEGHVVTSDGRYISTEWIYRRFNNYYSPKLKGKPKFFIIQACRGQETDIGFIGRNEISVSMSRKRRIGTDYDSQPFNDFDDTKRARPTWEDMIIAYSSIPGFASIRDHEHGTWFVQSLVEVFMNHAHDRELIDLLRMTSERLSKFSNDQKEKQTCNVEMRHLYKRIYFNPGIYHTNFGCKKLECDAKQLVKADSEYLNVGIAGAVVTTTTKNGIRRTMSTPPLSPRVRKCSQE